MSKQSCACSHHSLSWSRRVSSELWPQKVQGPPQRDPFYAPAGRVIHSLVSSATGRPRLLPGNREASPGQVRKLTISFGLSLVMDEGSISDEHPTVVSQHCRGPIPLVLFSHVGNVLMKTFAVLITDLPAVIRKDIQVEVQKVDL
ncbi:hypothetical protein AVEN_135284-1 [Araneus ventricosus]|uniref:Uncharacterized protein n=1 Tax=Araneus ventricosus TaxID=182803 RepID=A0A4Y2CNB9_ARAVE|nr:hypothetical protein AVEN_135284-1 [Araneus ventricosus]